MYGVRSKSKISTLTEDNKIGIPPSKLLPDFDSFLNSYICNDNKNIYMFIKKC